MYITNGCAIGETEQDREKRINNYIHILEILCASTSDFLYIYDVRDGRCRFFGDVCNHYDIDDKGMCAETKKDVISIMHPADIKRWITDVERVSLGKTDSHDGEYRLISKSGAPVWVRFRSRVIFNEDGTPFVVIGSVSQEAMQHMFNPLTGLFNKVRMREDINDMLKKGVNKYFMLVDINNLSAINLSHGRCYGDTLLKSLAEIIEKTDLTENIYHVENHYFAVCINTSSEETVKNIYNSILSQIEDKCTISAGAVPLSSSIFTNEFGVYDSAKVVLKNAKKSDASKIGFYSREEMSEKIVTTRLIKELQASVNNNFEGFYLNYQPQVRAGSYALYSAEALLRFCSADRGEVYPNEFIPLLEETGLINQVGMWVLETALTQCRKWREHFPDIRVSVNFSAVQFGSDIVSKVMSVLGKTHMPGNALTVEITESVQLSNPEHFADVLRQFKNAGIRIAIDDFGTGYSNMGYLKKLDVDEIKIDREFVKDIREDTYNYKLVRNIMDFAKINDIGVCCEGVEEKMELMVLEGLCPDLIQGYLFDKPCAPENIEKSYFDSQTSEYKNRTDFICELYRFKEDNGIINFDPRNILMETGVGLWIMRLSTDGDRCEMFVDKTMERVLGLDRKYSSLECYEFFSSRICDEYLEYVHTNVNHMIKSDKAVQLQYLWNHPEYGVVEVRSTGKCVSHTNGMVVLEGYHRIMTNVEEM